MSDYTPVKNPESWGVPCLQGMTFKTQAEAAKAAKLKRLTDQILNLFGDVRINRLAQLLLTTPEKRNALLQIINDIT